MAATTATGATSGYELDLDEYWQVIKRRRWIILFCAFSLGFFSWLFTWLNQPAPIYSSTASVKIERSTDLTGLLLQSVAFTPSNDMATQLAMIRSFTLLERVAKRLTLVPKELTSEQIRARSDYMNVILRLKENVSAEQEEDSSIINITAQASSPEFARDLAQAVAEEYSRFNVEEKNRRVLDAKAFIQQQLVVVGERLKKAEDALRRFRRTHKLLTEGEKTVKAGILAELEKDYRKNVARLNDLNFVLQQLRALVKKSSWDFQAITAAGAISPYFDDLNKRLVAMTLTHTELSTDYTDAHPRIIELRKQARDILKAMVIEVAKQVTLTKQRMEDILAEIEKTQGKKDADPTLDLQRLERAVKLNESLLNQLEEKYQEVLIKEAEKVQEVTIVRPAFLSPNRINPVRSMQTAIAGFVLGLVLGLVISLLMEAMDTSVGTIEEVESFLEVPVLGFVPHLSHEEAEELFSGETGLATSGSKLERQIRMITHFSPSATISEAYRSLRTNLLFSQSGEHQAIMVTSATVKEGKSTIAVNLATVVAQQGGRVLLVDADLRKPTVHKTFGLPREPGLVEYLLGQYAWQDATRRFSDVMLGDMGVDEALFTPGLDQLDLMTCGHETTNPPDLLSGEQMDRLIEEARQEYDLVVIDTPPMLHTTDAAVLASKVDGTLLVYHIGAVVRGALKRVKNSIESVNGQVIGVVLNGVRGELSPDFTKYKMDRYYAYTYGSEKETERPHGIIDQLVVLAKDALEKGSDAVKQMMRRGKGTDES